MEIKRFTTSPATSGLLLALRHIQNTKSAYYDAMEIIGGENYAGEELKAFDTATTPVLDLIEAKILEQIRDWAFMAKEMPAEI